MCKKSRKKIKNLENEKRFSDEIKSIFHHFWRAINESNKKKFFFGKWESNFNVKASITTLRGTVKGWPKSLPVILLRNRLSRKCFTHMSSEIIKWNYGKLELPITRLAEKLPLFQKNKCSFKGEYISARVILIDSQRKKRPYSELFWSAFSRIRTDYGEIRRISPYSVQIRKNADQNNSEYRHFSCSELNFWFLNFFWQQFGEITFATAQIITYGQWSN